MLRGCETLTVESLHHRSLQELFDLFLPRNACIHFDLSPLPSTQVIRLATKPMLDPDAAKCEAWAPCNADPCCLATEFAAHVVAQPSQVTLLQSPEVYVPYSASFRGLATKTLIVSDSRSNYIALHGSPLRLQKFLRHEHHSSTQTSTASSR